MPVGSALAWIDGLATLLPLGAAARLAHVASNHALAAITCAIALALSPAGTLFMAPATALAACGASSLVLLAMLREDRQRSIGAANLFFAGSALLAFLVPNLLAPVAALLAARFWYSHRNAGPAGSSAGTVLAGLIVIIAVLAMVFASGQRPLNPWNTAALRCGLPALAGAAERGVEAIRLISSMGPLPIALALTGALAWRTARSARTFAWFAAVALLPLAGGGVRQDLSAALAPSMAVFWCLAAIGLGTCANWARTRGERVTAGVVIGALVAILQLQHRASPFDANRGMAFLGHERLSVNLLSRSLPPAFAASLVQEDAATDLVVRGAAGRLVGPERTIRIVDDNPPAVRAAMPLGPVYVLPLRQLFLQHLGFRLAPVTGAPGLAVVGGSRSCVTVGSGWRAAPELTVSDRFSLAAADPHASARVRVLLGSMEPLEPAPLDWPEVPRQGWEVRSFESGDRGFAQWLKEQGVPAPAASFAGATHIDMVTLTRMPDGPLLLPVRLRRAPGAAAVALGSRTGSADPMLCPSFEYNVSPIR